MEESRSAGIAGPHFLLGFRLSKANGHPRCRMRPEGVGFLGMSRNEEANSRHRPKADIVHRRQKSRQFLLPVNDMAPEM